MKQLIQNLKTGKMELLEVPTPSLQTGKVLVRVHYSLISAGTEGGKVKTARSSLLKKAQQKPEQVKQVIDSVKTEGLSATYNKVMNKLDFPAPLGYSCSGEVIAVGEDCTNFKVGDFVARGGDNAVHAEVVCVPYNLCAKVPKNVDLRKAAFTTVASIAMQGFRQADLRLGETCVVIGLGLIGQITIQLLNSAGVRAFGIDIDQKMVDLAVLSGALKSIHRDDDKLESIILDQTNGHGVDAVIITAGTSSLDPVELSGRLCRRKGKVVVVGSVPTGFSRPQYYKKELELKMSSSYGPGRYDDNYEQKGLDYPIGYVRWTENRNMEAFLNLLSEGRLKIDVLLSHTFKFQDALKAYDLILGRAEPFTGIIFAYNTDSKIVRDIELKVQKKGTTKNSIGFVGAGSFAQKFLLPNIPSKYSKDIIATATGNSSINIASKFNFSKSTTDAKQVLNSKTNQTVFIATRHDSHAQYVLEGLKNNKNIFVEKPLTLKEEELSEIKKVYENSSARLMVGYNRRFAPLITKLMNEMGASTQKAINYRINVGNIPSDHWTQDLEIGGGRVIGEACHFIDLCMFIAGSKPTYVSAFATDDPKNLVDTLTINLKFENGSIANIAYFANGSKQLSKEHLEVFANGTTAIISDFKMLKIFGNRKKVIKSTQDKGHSQEVKQFLNSLDKDQASPIPFEELYLSSLISFKVLESIRTGQIIKVN